MPPRSAQKLKKLFIDEDPMGLTYYRLDKIGDYTECPTDEMVVVYSGVFSFKYVYFLMHEWFLENGWAPPEDQDFREDLYMQRESGSAKELFITWRLFKDHDDVYYHKFEMDLIIHVLGLSSTEIMIDGKKTKLDKGEVEFKIFGRIRKSDFFDNSIIKKNKHLWKWFQNKHLIGRRDHAFSTMKTDVERMRAAIKEYFDIERYSSDRELLEYYKGRMEQ